MIYYKITASRSSTHFFEIEFQLDTSAQNQIELQLPTWRPGRYQLQHFAKNIQAFTVSDALGFTLPFRKITKDRWLVETNGVDNILVKYNYYADVLNAGSSYVDEQYWYINPVNLCVYAEGFMNEPCSLELAIPENYTIACGLTKANNFTLIANDYYELVDSPLLASATLQHYTYEVGSTIFYVWFQGNISPDWPKILSDFEAFSKEQMATMGGFPEEKYHFINLVLPTPYYHGVEHRHSTMIVLGPGHEDEGFYSDLLGVSSHELFHAWNVIRIRPKELLPYDFTKENYFETCFVVEGVTTYYGDLFLRRSQVIDNETYIKELQSYMKRHFEADGRASQSLTQSSFDLWLDGYDKGIPDRKVSVYQKGALVALILDLTIRKKHNHGRSLDTVMQLLWQRFGTPFVGYSYDDYVAIVEEVMGEPLGWYWQHCIRGNTPLETILNDALAFVGLQMNSLADGSVCLEMIENENHNFEKWLVSIQNQYI